MHKKDMQAKQEKINEAENLKSEVKQSLKDMKIMSDDMFEALFEGAFEKAVNEMIEDEAFIGKRNLSNSIFSVLEEMTGKSL